jgi:tartrate-resistant acid phosphatase type 5
MTRNSAVLAVFLGALAACSPTSQGTIADDDDDVADASSQPVADAGPNDPDAAVPPQRLVRFVVLGDTGEGNAEQRQVAVVMRDVCAANGCDFAILLGDNFYENGVDSVDDELWDLAFEQPYADVPLPFYAVLGNHDYGGHISIFEIPGVGNEWEKGPIEVEYGLTSDKWIMPDTHYTFRFGHVGFIALDTNSIVWDDTTHGDQRAWWPTALAEVAGAEWKIAIGHHPYLSNGTHGNAGAYEAPELGGFIPPNPIPIVNGFDMKSYFDDLVCGAVDMYMSGHDHSRQWIDEPDALCGAQMIVSGAGSKVTSLVDRGNDTLFQDASKEGFMYVVIDGNTFTGRFYDKFGVMEYEHSFTRP